ncbi:MAG: DUF2723 domain-containing protein [candidate division Zixibacteria bacterium]
MIKDNYLHKSLAGALFIISLIIYNMTKAPTLSFWDCGEFITCAHILGIPHPPGNPLWVLLGRIFSILPLHEDISARVNMFSAVSGAFAVMFAYLVTRRLIIMWWKPGQIDGWRRFTAYVGAVVGSMMFGFSQTQWNNSVETEVYSPAMLLMIIIIWLLLRWIEEREKPTSVKYLLLINFLAFLSIGIHLTTFLIMPAVFITVILYSPRLRREIFFYVTGFCLVLIAHNIDLFLWSTGIWLLAAILGVIITRKYIWKFSLALILAAIIGYSVQIYTPIRSAQKPAINQNDPSYSFAAFKNFLERRQYGRESMIERAMMRRAELKNQFGVYPRMGFWGFFSNQYGINGRSFAFVFVLGLLGIWELMRRRSKIGIPFFLLILLGTVFLVWYMNFADGTRIDPLTGDGNLEVRDRDYFFTPGFILFGIAIGLGIAALMEMARESILFKSKILRRTTMFVLSLLVFLGAVPVVANYHVSDRSGNYIPYDFAYNNLISCDVNSILFIGGDNDTFPVWCLQNVYKIRTDVTVVNLSLANMDWYIRQIRNTKKIPIRWTDSQISNLRHRLLEGQVRYRIQDQVHDEILAVNRWQRPIHYSISIPPSMRQYRGQKIDDRLVMQGMVHRLESGDRPGQIDMEKAKDLYFSKFKFRSIADDNIYKDERTKALTGNYTTGLTLMADSLRMLGQFEEAIELAAFSTKIVPYNVGAYNYLAQLYIESGQEHLVDSIVNFIPRERAIEMYYTCAMTYDKIGNRQKAKEVMSATLDTFPHFYNGFRLYSKWLFEDQEWNRMRAVIANWLKNNPDDPDAPKIIETMRTLPASQNDTDSRGN